MKDSQTLWIDVTMLVNWSGRMTGIQRVEYNLAKRYADSQKRVRFCVFDKERVTFIPFDFAHIEYKITHQQEDGGVAASTASLPSKSTLSMRHYAKKALKKALPSTVWEAGKKYKNSHTPEKEVKVKFTSNDTVLVLSGDWSDTVFAEYMARLKTEHGIKVIQIVYDMLPVLFPSYFIVGMPKQFDNYMKRMLSLSDAVLAISESTKKDVVAYMKGHSINLVPVQVFRLGNDFVKTDAKRPSNHDLKEHTYVLTVCTVEARKNHLLLYYAVREAVMKRADIPLIVLAGKKGWLVDDLYYLIKNDPVISKKIIFIEQPSDSELAWLYRNSLFTVFPSFYEGWGLPVAESLFYGKFCLSSNASSMPEIAGSLVDYFSPNDPIDLLAKIEYYYHHKKELSRKESAILKKYKQPTWDDAYKQVSSFIESIL